MPMALMQLIEGKGFSAEGVHRIQFDLVETMGLWDLHNNAILWVVNDTLSILESYRVSSLVNLADRDKGISHVWHIEDILKFDLCGG